MLRIFILIICAFTGLSAEAQSFSRAARTVEVPAFYMHSAHGDIVCANPPGETIPANCLQYADWPTADLTATGTENLGRGVMQANHKAVLTFTNLSTVKQTLRITIKNSSGFGGNWYNVGSDVPNYINPNYPLPIVTPDISMDPGTTHQVQFYSVCSMYPSSRCCMETYVDGASRGPDCQAHLPKAYPASPPLMAVGMAQDSTWAFRLEVGEARGAINGSITTWIHRHYGKKDKTSGEQIIPINGGRPF